MKRDMDLVRQILILTAESDSGLDASAIADEHNDLQTVIYTMEIMEEAGLIRANIVKAFGGIYVSGFVRSLTWEGNDFLDAIQSDKVWTQVKKAIAKTTRSASMLVIKKVAEKILSEMLL